MGGEEWREALGRAAWRGARARGAEEGVETALRWVMGKPDRTWHCLLPGNTELFLLPSHLGLRSGLESLLRGVGPRARVGTRARVTPLTTQVQDGEK